MSCLSRATQCSKAMRCFLQIGDKSLHATKGGSSNQGACKSAGLLWVFSLTASIGREQVSRGAKDGAQTDSLS